MQGRGTGDGPALLQLFVNLEDGRGSGCVSRRKGRALGLPLDWRPGDSNGRLLLDRRPGDKERRLPLDRRPDGDREGRLPRARRLWERCLGLPVVTLTFTETRDLCCEGCQSLQLQCVTLHRDFPSAWPFSVLPSNSPQYIPLPFPLLPAQCTERLAFFYFFLQFLLHVHLEWADIQHRCCKIVGQRWNQTVFTRTPQRAQADSVHPAGLLRLRDWNSG